MAGRHVLPVLRAALPHQMDARMALAMSVFDLGGHPPAGLQRQRHGMAAATPLSSSKSVIASWGRGKMQARDKHLWWGFEGS